VLNQELKIREDEQWPVCAGYRTTLRPISRALAVAGIRE
jgi:hypothetical protein